MIYKGNHVTCDVKLNGDIPENIIEIIELGIKESNMNVVRNIFHKFVPQGITAVWVLSESHFTLHTYPEERYLSMDCYTCGKEGDPQNAMDTILKRLNVCSSSIKKIKRGEV